MSGRIGSSTSLMVGVPALDVAAMLKRLDERTRAKDRIRSALDSLEKVGDTTIVRLEMLLVPKTFSRSLGDKGTFIFIVNTDGAVHITRTR